MTQRHVDDVAYGWYERAGRNPWFDRATGKVEFPDTIKDKRNFLLSEEEVARYAALMMEIRDFAQHECNRAMLVSHAMSRGRLPFGMREREPNPLTFAHALEAMLRVARTKLDILHWMNDVAKRRVAQIRDRSSHSLGDDHADTETQTPDPGVQLPEGQVRDTPSGPDV